MTYCWPPNPWLGSVASRQARYSRNSRVRRWRRILGPYLATACRSSLFSRGPDLSRWKWSIGCGMDPSRGEERDLTGSRAGVTVAGEPLEVEAVGAGERGFRG